MARDSKKVDRETRREQITEAALQIVGDRGVKGLTTAALAKEVGVSEANLYRHFENKDEILLETVGRIGETLRCNLERVLAESSSPSESLKKIFILHLDYIEKNKGIPRLVFSNEIHVDNNRLREKLFSTIDSYARRLEELLREWRSAGSIKESMDPAPTALTLIGMIQALTMKWSLSGFSFSLVDEGRRLWANFERCMQTG